MKTTFYRIVFISLAGLTFSGCNSEPEIRVYRLAKEELPLSEPLAAEISWTKPRVWKEEPAGGMRQGSFRFDGEGDESVDISIIFLDGDAGGDLSNVNRWRQQIELAEWSQEELEGNEQMLATSIGPAKLVDFASQERIIVAIIPYQQGTWFFKMIGQKELVTSQKETFVSFLSTIQSASKR